jgi:hypothetical protein
LTEYSFAIYYLYHSHEFADLLFSQSDKSHFFEDLASSPDGDILLLEVLFAQADKLFVSEFEEQPGVFVKA